MEQELYNLHLNAGFKAGADKICKRKVQYGWEGGPLLSGDADELKARMTGD